jgi:hypothetical protein
MAPTRDRSRQVPVQLVRGQEPATGPAALVLDLDLVREISALVPVGVAVRSYPNPPHAWPSIVPVASSRQPHYGLVPDGWLDYWFVVAGENDLTIGVKHGDDTTTSSIDCQGPC